MGKYFISTREQTGWRLDADELLNALKRHWPEVRVTSDRADQHRLLAFELPLKYSTLYGHLDASGDAVVVDGDVRDAANLAVWLRSFVPDPVQLLLWDEGYTADVAITGSASATELAHVFMRGNS
jgi:hypothetical protein